MSDAKKVEFQLQRPFDEEDIKWRVQQADIPSSGRPYVKAVPYVSNRAIQKRLDEVFGTFGWENAYKPTPDGKGYLCGITIHSSSRSVTKWDGAEYSNIEPLKGALSDSMKRSAVQLGIGRYLYQLEACFADCYVVENRRDADNLHIHFPQKQNKSIRVLISWSTPILPEWALPFEDHSEFIDKIKNAEDMEQLRIAFSNAYKAGQASLSEELKEQSIRAKDKRKAEIALKINEINTRKFNEIDLWLDKEVLMLNELPTKSTVENYKTIIAENLSNRTRNQPFDCSQLKSKLDQKCQDRLKQIK